MKLPKNPVIYKIVYEGVVCEMATILLEPQCVDYISPLMMTELCRILRLSSVRKFPEALG